ncbi:MAG: hypothetical protein ACK4PI_07795 [Tepidisphaerales bacterium]
MNGPARCAGILAWLGLLAVGCAPKGELRRFDIEVTNRASIPVTIGLVKLDGPVEIDWESPEDRALMDPKNTGIGWGQALPPGRTASISVQGRFFEQTRGFLRVYAGDLPLSEILAISRGSRNRLDILLKDGTTQVTILNDGPFLDFTITGYTPPPPPR